MTLGTPKTTDPGVLVMEQLQMDRCRVCGAEIILYRNKDGKILPFDTKKTVLLSPPPARLEGGTHRVYTGYACHLYTCKGADHGS